ncbi:hypothetical protein ACLHDF_01965 [Priestia aryabhattai]|uniref:hypothetical protein n=1 Tax=Priestia megaterium TaxID=1404 RepID=UPI0039B8B4A7
MYPLNKEIPIKLHYTFTASKGNAQTGAQIGVNVKGQMEETCLKAEAEEEQIQC